MRKIVLIRHAESESNVGTFVEKQHLVSLTDKGFSDSLKFAETVDAPDRIIVSRYVRTLLTSKPLIEKYPQVVTVTWDEIHEFNYIDREIISEKNMESLTVHVKNYWKLSDPFYKHGGNSESFQEFADRAAQAYFRFKNLEGVNYVFTHGLFMRMILLLNRKYENYFEIIRDKDFYINLFQEYGEIYEEKYFKNLEIFDLSEML